MDSPEIDDGGAMVPPGAGGARFPTALTASVAKAAPGMRGAATTQELLEELGSTGLKRAGDYILADFLPQLNGQHAARIYAEMGANEPLIGGILFAFEMLLRRVPMQVEVAGEDQTSPAALEAKALARRMLFSELARPWAEVMGEAATMFQFGYAALEVLYRVDPVDGLMVAGLSLRDHQTITRWAFDTRGQVTGLYQQDPYQWSVGGRPEQGAARDAVASAVAARYAADRTVQEVFIPRTKLALFRTTAKLDNPEGRSLLRTLYPTWMQKRVIEEAEARAALRQAGLVVATVPGRLLSQTASPEEKQQLAGILAVVEAVSADRQAAVVLPSDVDPESKAPLFTMAYTVADGQRSGDMSPLIERRDKRMAGAVLADFMLLGQQATGSFALSKDKTELFTLALFGFVDVVTTEVNQRVLAPWWRLRGGDPAVCPKLVPGGVEEADLSAIAGYISALTAAGVLTPDEKLEEHVRKYGDLPAPDPTTARRDPRAALAETRDMAGGGGGVNPGGAVKGKVAGARSKKARGT